MDAHHFDSLARSLTDASSRRGIVRGLAAATLGLAAIYLPGEAEGRKKRKKRKKGTNSPALQLNDFQCVDVGQACRGDSANCCSGICEDNAPQPDKADTSRCVAHNVGACQPGQDSCESGLIPCGPNASCSQTTGGAPFCAGPGKCIACRKDTDCEADFGAGAACIVCSDCEETGTACVPAAA